MGAVMFTYRVNDDITLELQSPAHAAMVFQLVDANRDFIGRYQSWAYRMESLADAQGLLQRDLMGMANGRRWAWLIYYQGQPAGRIGLFVTMPDLQECEISYWLAEAFTGKGIVTRSIRTVLDFAFTELNLRHALIGFDPANVKSKAIPERLGFQSEFSYRKHDLVKNEWRDLQFYGLLRDDWQVTTQPQFILPVNDTLHLRLQQVHDADVQFALIEKNLETLRQWFLFAHDNHTAEKERVYTTQMLQKYAKDEGLMLGIWQDDTLLGSIGLYVDVDDNKAALGYWLDSDTHGKGIMTRCVRVLVDDCFTRRKVHRVEIRAAVDNTASRRVAEKLGMQQEAILRHEQLLNGQYVDLVLYGIMANEWEAQKV
jgi:ribosomal-protein-serine acetyltransferase